MNLLYSLIWVTIILFNKPLDLPPDMLKTCSCSDIQGKIMNNFICPNYVLRCVTFDIQHQLPKYITPYI